MRRRQRRELARRLGRLRHRIEAGRLKQRDKMVQCLGRLKAKFPKAVPFVTMRVTDEPRLEYTWHRDQYRAALAADGAYLLRSNQAGWSSQEICVLAYALWKTLDQLAKQAGLQTLIRKPDEDPSRPSPKPRPMTPEAILRELGRIQLGDIHLETSDGRELVLRRVARPTSEQARILAALKLELPERLSPDRLL